MLVRGGLAQKHHIFTMKPCPDRRFHGKCVMFWGLGEVPDPPPSKSVLLLGGVDPPPGKSVLPLGG